jgi:sulfopyruvate decarboxylase subunit alpha
LGERDPWQTQGGNVTEPLLRALRIPYSFLDTIETVKKRIRRRKPSPKAVCSRSRFS